MVPLAREAGLELSGGLSTSFGCPFEGDVPLEQLDRVVERWMQTGVRAFTLGDTTGVGHPKQVYIETGIDLDALLAVAKRLQEVIPHPLASHVLQAGKRTNLKPAPRVQEKIGESRRN